MGLSRASCPVSEDSHVLPGKQVIQQVLGSFFIDIFLVGVLVEDQIKLVLRVLDSVLF